MTVLGCVDDESWECPGWWVETAETHAGDGAADEASLLLLDAASSDASLPWGARSLRPSAAEWTDDTHHQLGMARLRSFVQLRTLEATPGVRLVLQLAPPGASAPPVSSAGQGRLLLAAAALAAALPSGGSARAEATQTAQQLYRGWRAMAAVSWDGCEITRGCGATGSDECFPAWQLATLPAAADGTIALARGASGGGNSSDAGGDVDGVLGLVLLTLATEAEQPEGWRELASWTYASCRAFLLHLSAPSFDDPAYLHAQQLRGEATAGKGKATTAKAAAAAPTGIDGLDEEQLLPLLFRGAPYASIRQQRRRGVAAEGQHATAGGARMLRLSSCSGGWACTRPGLHSPAHYRAMRDFMLAFAGRRGEPLRFGDAAEGARLEPLWDALIATSHMLLHDVQSPTGLVPNSVRPMCLEPGPGATAACAGCGEADGSGGEFGVSASAVAWRIYLDAVWWPHEQPEAQPQQQIQTQQRRLRQLRDRQSSGGGGGGASYGATTFVHRLATQAATAIMQPNATARRLDAGNGLVSSAYAAWDGGDWPEYAFMLGPMAAALMLRPSATALPSSTATATATATGGGAGHVPLWRYVGCFADDDHAARHSSAAIYEAVAKKNLDSLRASASNGGLESCRKLCVAQLETHFAVQSTSRVRASQKMGNCLCGGDPTLLLSQHAKVADAECVQCPQSPAGQTCGDSGRASVYEVLMPPPPSPPLPPPPPLSVQAALAEAAEAVERQHAKEVAVQQRQRVLDHAAEMLGRLEVGAGGTTRHGDPFADEWLVLSVVTVGGALPSLAPALRALRGRPRAIPDSWGTDPFLPYPPPPPSPLAGFYSSFFAPPPPLPPPDALGRSVNTLAVQETFTLAGPICLLLCAFGAMLLRLQRRMKVRALVAKVPGPPRGAAAAARRRPASRAADGGVSTSLGRGFDDARRSPRVVPRPERPAADAAQASGKARVETKDQRAASRPKSRGPQGREAAAGTSRDATARDARAKKEAKRGGWFGALGLGAGKAASAAAPAAVEMASASRGERRAEEDDDYESERDGEEVEEVEEEEESEEEELADEEGPSHETKAESAADDGDGDREEDEGDEEDEELVTMDDDDEGEGDTTHSLFVVVSPGKKSGASFLRHPRSNVVARVARGSNAETAGLRRGDEVVRTDGDEVGRDVAVEGLLDAPVTEVSVKTLEVRRKTGSSSGGGVSRRKAKRYDRLQESLDVF